MTGCPDCPHMDATRMPEGWTPRPTCCRDHAPQPVPDVPGQSYPDVPPARVSSNPNHPWFHPSYFRIGVALDGERRPDVFRYDVGAGLVWSNRSPGRTESGVVTVWWLHGENRQQRRTRERWEASTGYRPEPAPPPSAPPVEPLWQEPADVVEAEKRARGGGKVAALGIMAAAALSLGGCYGEGSAMVQPSPELVADVQDYAAGLPYRIALDHDAVLECGIVTVGDDSRLFVHDGVQLLVQPVTTADGMTQAKALQLSAFLSAYDECLA